MQATKTRKEHKLPIIEHYLINSANNITKAQWIELYRDLYIQTHGGYPETAHTEAWLEDAQQRQEVLETV